MEDIEEYLQQFRGTTGVPLSYVIRREVKPPLSSADPSTNYATISCSIVA